KQGGRLAFGRTLAALGKHINEVITWPGRRGGIRRREGARRGLGAPRHHRRPIYVRSSRDIYLYGVPCVIPVFGRKGYGRCDWIAQVREVGTPVHKATARLDASAEWAG